MCHQVRYINGSSLTIVSKKWYLEHTISINEKDEVAIQKESRAVYAKGNVLLRKFKICSTEFKKQLFTSYCSIQNWVPPGQHHKDIVDLLCERTHHHEALTSLEVQNDIMDLKLNKASDLDTLSAEYFRYASNRLPVFLSLCLNAMLLHGHLPKSFSGSNN